jgi:hypothetical protein
MGFFLNRRKWHKSLKLIGERSVYSDDNIVAGAYLICHKLGELVGENAGKVSQKLDELLEENL